MKRQTQQEADDAKAKRYQDGLEFEAKQRLVHVQTFLERLAFRARRSDDLATAEECARLLSIVEHKPLANADLDWVRTWWSHLAALDADYFPGLYRSARARRLPSPLWRFGSALNMTESEFRERGERVRKFADQKNAERGTSANGVTIEALASDFGKGQG